MNASRPGHLSVRSVDVALVAFVGLQLLEVLVRVSTLLPPCSCTIVRSAASTGFLIFFRRLSPRRRNSANSHRARRRRGFNFALSTSTVYREAQLRPSLRRCRESGGRALSHSSQSARTRSQQAKTAARFKVNYEGGTGSHLTLTLCSSPRLQSQLQKGRSFLAKSSSGTGVQ